MSGAGPDKVLGRLGVLSPFWQVEFKVTSTDLLVQWLTGVVIVKRGIATKNNVADGG